MPAGAPLLRGAASRGDPEEGDLRVVCLRRESRAEEKGQSKQRDGRKDQGQGRECLAPVVKQPFLEH